MAPARVRAFALRGRWPAPWSLAPFYAVLRAPSSVALACSARVLAQPVPRRYPPSRSALAASAPVLLPSGGALPRLRRGFFALRAPAGFVAPRWFPRRFPSGSACSLSRVVLAAWFSPTPSRSPPRWGRGSARLTWGSCLCSGALLGFCACLFALHLGRGPLPLAQARRAIFAIVYSPKIVN